MNMEFYRELYVSRSLKKREKRIIEGLKKKRFRKDLYLIVLAQGKQNPLEFFSVLLLKQHIFEDAGLFVVGRGWIRRGVGADRRNRAGCVPKNK